MVWSWPSTHQEFSKRMEAGNYNVKNFRSKIHGEKCSGGLYTLILSILDMVFNKIIFSNIWSCIYLVYTQLIYLINWSYLSVIKTTHLNGFIFFFMHWNDSQKKGNKIYSVIIKYRTQLRKLCWYCIMDQYSLVLPTKQVSLLKVIRAYFRVLRWSPFPFVKMLEPKVSPIWISWEPIWYFQHY